MSDRLIREKSLLEWADTFLTQMEYKALCADIESGTIESSNQGEVLNQDKYDQARRVVERSKAYHGDNALIMSVINRAVRLEQEVERLSNQGEAARLLSALRNIRERRENSGVRDIIWAIADEALSSQTEDTEASREQFALSLSRRQLVKILARHSGNPSLKEMLCAEADEISAGTEDTGIQGEYKIGQPVGIAWEPHNRDFEVCDIRHIQFEQSGKRTIEYQLCRIGKPDYMTDWLSEDRIFTIPGITDGGEEPDKESKT